MTQLHYSYPFVS